MALPDRARSDVNYKKSLIAVSNADGESPVSLWADPSTHALLTSGGGGSSGTVPLVSTNNSSTATLTSGSTFTGTFEDVTNYGLINVAVFSDVASATDGLVLQQSSNGTNWDITDSYTIAAGTGKTFSVPRQEKFFRIVYTNGGTNQTSFRLQTIFTPNVSKGSSVRAADGVSNENDLEQVAGFGMLYNGTTWDRAPGTAARGQLVQNNPDSITTGTITAAAQTVVLPIPAGMRSVGIEVNGTYGAATLVFEADYNNNGVFGLVAVTQTGTTTVVGSTAQTLSANATVMWGTTLTPGVTNFRVQCSAYTTGTLNIVLAAGVQPFVSTPTVVGISSVIPGVAATGLGKAEDAVHASGDTGVFILGVRNDGAATAFTNANGDYNPIGTDTQGRVYVVQKGPTATLTNVASSATSVNILVANTARVGAQFYNDSTQICYLKFGTTASSTSFTVPLAAATYYELPAGYTGNIDGIWVSANGNLRVTEIS